MPQPSPFDRRDALAALAILGAWCGFLAASTGSLSAALVDDAYIFLRVVDHVLAGEGWTYNLQEASNPISSPLFALALLPGRLAGLGAGAVLVGTYLLGLGLLSAVQYLAFRGTNRWLALVMALALPTSAVLIKSIGMETSLFLAAVAGSVLCFERGKLVAAGALAGLAALGRPEGLALVGILAVVHLVRARRFPLSLVIAWAVPVGLWAVFAWWSFGNVVPNSVAAKAVQTSMADGAWTGSYLGDFLTQPWLPWVTWPLAAVGVFATWERMKRREVYAAILIAFGAAQVAGYVAMGAPTGYWWYHAPGNFAVDLLVVLGAFRGGAWLWGLVGRREQPVLGLLGAVAVLALATQFGMQRARLVEPYRLAAEYEEAGRWIQANTPADVRVACTEIGVLGYFSQREIRDIHGLLHAEALEPLQRGEWAWWFHADRPEVVVVHLPPWPGEPGTTSWSFEESRTFQREYRLVCQVGASGESPTTVAIYLQR